MKTETKIKTVLKCSKCGSDILCVGYNYDDYDYATGLGTVRTSYKCSKCHHIDTGETVVEGFVTEEVSRPYTNEELEDMIKEHEYKINELYIMVDQLARALSDHKQGIDR